MRATVGVVNAAILPDFVDLLEEASRSYKLEASLPPDLERAPLAQILTIADRPEDREAALHEIHRLVVAVLRPASRIRRLLARVETRSRTHQRAASAAT